MEKLKYIFVFDLIVICKCFNKIIEDFMLYIYVEFNCINFNFSVIVDSWLECYVIFMLKCNLV